MVFFDTFVHDPDLPYGGFTGLHQIIQSWDFACQSLVIIQYFTLDFINIILYLQSLYIVQNVMEYVSPEWYWRLS